MVDGKCVSQSQPTTKIGTATNLQTTPTAKTSLGSSSVGTKKPSSTAVKLGTSKQSTPATATLGATKPVPLGSSRIEESSTPNTANPTKIISEDSIKAIKEKITLGGGVSVNSQNKPRTAIYDNIDAKQTLGSSSGKAISTPTITPTYRPFPVTEAKPVTKADESAGYRYLGTPLKQ
jgi:hypothetical protein